MQNSTVLMSSPEYFRLEYSINPWMIEGVEVNLELAKDQWSGLKSTIEKCGAEVKVIPGNTVYPDLVFTANSGIIKDKSVLISNFKFQERRGEEIIYENWFKKNGYDVARIPSEYKFEGRGDAFVYGEYLIGSYGVRSDKEALIYIAEQFELKPKIVKLVDEKFYHLDTCFQKLPTNNNDAIFYPEAFEDSSLSEFSDLFNLIPVGENDANKLACNSFVINESVIFPSDDIDIIETVADLGCNIEISNVSEFLKSGGACQCLVITLQ